MSESARTPDAVDLPDLSSKGDEVRGVRDELERGRPVQAVHDDGECAVPVDLDERAGVRQRITRVDIRVDRAVRQGVETAAAAKFHVKEEGDAGGYLRSGGRFRLERHNLAGLGQVGVGAGLGHVHRIASHLQPGRDDVVERDQHGDLPVECDPQHAVEVRIGDQEAATVALQRVLESGVDEVIKGHGWRIVQVELANVSNDGETVWAVHSVDAVNVAAGEQEGIVD